VLSMQSETVRNPGAPIRERRPVVCWVALVLFACDHVNNSRCPGHSAGRSLDKIPGGFPTAINIALRWTPSLEGRGRISFAE